MLTVDGIGEYVYQRNVEKKCPNFLDGDAALDLINRLQAENSNLTSDLTSLQSDLTSVKAEIEELEAEIEKQYEQAEADILGNMADGGASCHWCIDQHESNARKEFAERLKGKMYIKKDKLYYSVIIDNLLAELDGKENV
jgi:hypothetical protein